MINQKGVVPVLVLLAVVGVVLVLAVSSLAPFRNNIFNAIFPKQASQAAVDEWFQDGHDAQRTGAISEEPTLPWTYLWSFNGPDATGSAANHFYDAPKEARIVTGGELIYVPAGVKGLYALRKTNGSIVWNLTNTSFNATPVFDPSTQSVFAGGSNGQVYKINAGTGAILGTFNVGSPVNKALLLNGGFVYALADNGKLSKISVANVSPVWTYTANSAAATTTAYSSTRDSIIFATADLNVHAVKNSDGVLKWKVKPTPNSPGDATITATQTASGAKVGTQFDFGWPVVAEKNGVVFVRLQLKHQALYEGPNSGKWGTTNAENRAWLIQNPQWKNLFALNLDDGSEKFIPAVGYGSTEDFIPSLNSAYGVMGSQPVVKVYPDGSEVVYIHFRNGQTTPASDYRWSGHMGEMVLNETTIPGMVAGDLRFVRMGSYGGYGGTAPVHIIDEQTPLTIAGTMLFNAHWAASAGVKITDRSNSKGLSYSTPIETTKLPTVIRAQKSCANYIPTTHYTTCSLNYVTDGGRFFDGPGFWGYWNVADPPGWRVGIPTAIGSSYSAGFLPRYTYVSDGLIIVQGNGGELLVFRHSGTVVNTPAASATPVPSSSPSPSPSSSSPISAPVSPSPVASVKVGDIDGNGRVDIFDYNILLTNFGKTGSGIGGDINGSGKVDIFDYNQLLTNFGT